MLLSDGAVLAEAEPHQHLPAEGADPQRLMRKTRLDRKPGRRDRNRHPIAHRLLEPVPGQAEPARPAGIVDAVSRKRPPIVAARQNEIELVAALRPVLVGPEPSGLWIEGEALRVAVPIAPDLRPRARNAAEWIVVGNRPVR